jgi:hypothetical protein
MSPWVSASSKEASGRRQSLLEELEEFGQGHVQLLKFSSHDLDLAI